MGLFSECHNPKLLRCADLHELYLCHVHGLETSLAHKVNHAYNMKKKHAENLK
jgi:hypothetical protein